MEAPNRGRSPSAGQQANQRIRSSPSPHDFNGHVSPLNFNNQPPNQEFTSQPFNNNNLSPTSGGNISFTNSSSYLDAGSQQQFLQPQSLTSGSEFNNQGFDELFQAGGLTANEQGQPNFDPRESDPQFQSEMLALNTNFGGFPHQQGFNVKREHYNKNDLFLDPQLQNAQQSQDQSINPADIMNPADVISNVSSPQNLVPTTPHLLQVNSQHSEPTSPFGQPSHDWSPGHSRHASLDPSAAYGNGQQQEWGGMMQGPQFQQHRRAPSEHSDVSSSVAPSPYMPQSDTFEFDQSASPMLGPQRDNHLYQDGLGIGSFSISDDKSQNHSPRHSPFVSPRMSPQPGLGAAKEMSFMGLPETQRGFGGQLTPEGYPTSSEQFPVLPPEQRLPSNDYGQADQYDVPQINVDPAPMAHPPLMEQHPRSPTDMDALSPPEQRGRKGNRMRAKSDTYISRPVTPSSTAPTIGSSDSSIARNHSLSPHDMAPFVPNSRSPSPTPRSPSARRSSTSSIPNRDYILELADPNRPPAPGTEKRVQKHPATFSCHLCPKKFTRAYNLRSHLRTHTDERPFVCTVCSKAFARQHDRKRHEGLHSGEKKFVCRGELGTGAAWGCGRRFARADALGRHFRSEAGRVCIKPLLDEEAMERQRLDDHMMAQNMGGMAPQAPMNGMGMQQPFAFPAALLQQFPQLQNMQWDQMQGPDEEDYSRHSSFDASSGGDFYDDEDGASGYVSDNPMGVGYGNSSAWQSNQGWKSDVEP